jgi:predicted O-methyltransferase YrrM
VPLQIFRKLVNFAGGPHRAARLRNFAEIYLNKWTTDARPRREEALAFDAFRQSAPGGMATLLALGGEAEAAVRDVRARFKTISAAHEPLPFPVIFNADVSFAQMSYALARSLACEAIVETGVGYGVTSAVILRALKCNGRGKLTSIDLPALGDPHGKSVGLAVEETHRDRWRLCRGSTRRWLPHILDETPAVDLFVSDSANVFTLQRAEFETVWPHVRQGGAVLFNNISAKFKQFLDGTDAAATYVVWQVEKSSCASALAFR